MGGMGAPMMGPPPAELEGRFKILKLCVLGMLGGTAVRILTSFFLPLSPGQVILASLNIILNTIIGIFMLKYDPLIGRMHNFLVTTCCRSCDESCGGGMSCLMTFVLCNAMTIFFDVLLNGIIGWIIHMIGAVFDPSQWTSSIFGFMLGLNVLAVIVAYVAQIVGAVQGFMAWRQAQAFGVTAQQGEWGSGGQGGGGPFMGGGGRGYPAAREDAPAREARPAQNFQPFGGSGNRLGS